MKKPIYIILALIIPFLGLSQSPHGADFKIDCSSCHMTKGWTVSINSISFDHATTNFTLEGQHKMIDCKMCHNNLQFSTLKNVTSCTECHTDMHQTTVGQDCARCHSTKAWIISDIKTLHDQSRFPLLGAHATAFCSDCHKSESNLMFEPLGVECIDCHRQNYMATTTPNHISVGYSTNCIECHNENTRVWYASNFNHDIFPLNAGHGNLYCAQCHKPELSEPLISECYSCHKSNYEATNSPNHSQLAFTTTCEVCHTTAPGWKSGDWKEHDSRYFPIYSGKHKGEWDNCTTCHSNSSNFAAFECINCHEHGKLAMNAKHSGRRDYAWVSSKCFECHPRGQADD